MPKLTPSSISLNDKAGSDARMDMKTVYDRKPSSAEKSTDTDPRSFKNKTPYHEELHLNVLGGYDAIVANELEHKELFLRTLNQLLHERGHDTDARALFAQIAHHPVDELLHGSQPLILLRDFTRADRDKIFGCFETTTHYGFRFDFFEQDMGEPLVRQPFYEIDARAWELLEHYGVEHAMRQRYCEKFMRMADMSGHDYLHQIVDPLTPYAHDVFPNPFHNPRVDKRIPSKLYLEQYTLALHAQICAELFREPNIGERRKAAVLRLAHDTIEQLADMQETALSNARTPEEHKKIGEAITYLTEIYAHRLFRVISPTDPDLRKPLEPKNGGAPVSIAESLDKLHLQTPAHLCVPNYKRDIPLLGFTIATELETLRRSLKRGHDKVRRALNKNYGQPEDGLARITRHTEGSMGNTYTRIHEDSLSRAKLYHLGKPQDEFEKTADIDNSYIFADQPSSLVNCVDAVALFAQTALPEMDKKAAQNTR